MDRRRVASGSPYEPVIGFSRAAVAGHHVSVAATAPIMPDGGEPPADAYGQAKRSLEIIVAALEEAGASAADVVRTRCYLVAAEDWQEVGWILRTRRLRRRAHRPLHAGRIARYRSADTPWKPCATS